MADTTADTAGLGNAYVSAMWGEADEHVFLAMALGQSLSDTGTRLPRILLHTYDVPLCHCQVLRRWWTLKLVPYIECDPDLNANDRFHYVFTKLHIFNPEFVPFYNVFLGFRYHCIE